MKVKEIQVPSPVREEITDKKSWTLDRKVHDTLEGYIEMAETAVNNLSRATKLISAIDAEDGINLAYEPLGGITGKVRNHVKSTIIWAQHQVLARQVESLMNEIVPGLEKNLTELCSLQEIPDTKF